MRPDGRPSGPGRPAPARVFFALWPDAAGAADLARIAGEAARLCGGRATRQETLHLTLAFLGNLAVDRLPALAAAVDGLAAEAFDFALDHLGYWRHNRIVWAGGPLVPALGGLVASLVDRLAAAGFVGPEKGRPFVPHVTLVRHADHACAPLPAIAPLVWPCREIVLVRSCLAQRGPAYQPLGRWPLRA